SGLARMRARLVGSHRRRLAGSRPSAISTGMLAGDGESSRGEKSPKIVTSECININRVPHDLRRGQSAQVETEGVGLSRWTLTADRTGAKNAASGMPDRREIPARPRTVAGLGRSAGRPHA